MQIHTPRSLERVHGLDLAPSRHGLVATMLRTLLAARGGLGRTMRLWRADIHAQRERAAFLALPDHLLRDIGASRQEAIEPSRARSGW